MIYLIKPKNYKLIHGQFIWMNIPSIHSLQWHPFTVASSPSNPYLILMIKRAGDWTGKLIDTFYECKKKAMKVNELNNKYFDEFDVFNLLHDIHQELKVKD
jgi:predicted ferric reductase